MKQSHQKSTNVPEFAFLLKPIFFYYFLDIIIAKIKEAGVK